MSDRVYCDHCDKQLPEGKRHIRIVLRHGVVGLPTDPATQPPLQILDFCCWQHMAIWAGLQMATPIVSPEG